jgi:hypothetical protein
MNIALVAKRGSGKTTISNALVQQGYQRLSWADPVRELAAMAYDPRFTGTPEEYSAAKASEYQVTSTDKAGFVFTEFITGTTLLQRIGTDAMRDGLDQDFWVKAALGRMERAEREAQGEPIHWVNDDTRFPNELEALRERGFVIVGLHVPDVIRHARLVSRDGFYDASAENHASETSVSLDDCDIVVDTSQTVDDVIQRLWSFAFQRAMS